MTSGYSYLMDSVEDMALACLGLFASPESGCRIAFDESVRLECHRDGFAVHVDIHTNSGSLQSVVEISPQMLRKGIAQPWVRQPLIRRFDDWRIVAAAFEAATVISHPESYRAVQALLGDDGLVVSPAAVEGTSPMHHIQKCFFEGTDFFVLNHDRRGSWRSSRRASRSSSRGSLTSPKRSRRSRHLGRQPR